MCVRERERAREKGNETLMLLRSEKLKTDERCGFSSTCECLAECHRAAPRNYKNDILNFEPKRDEIFTFFIVIACMSSCLSGYQISPEVEESFDLMGTIGWSSKKNK